MARAYWTLAPHSVRALLGDVIDRTPTCTTGRAFAPCLAICLDELS